MKKFALIAAATAASFGASAPAAFADASPVQFLKVKLTSTKAGTTKKPTNVGITVTTGTSNSTGDPTKKFTITHATISLPKGIKINYKDFPACSDATTCADSAPKSKIGSGTATAQVVGIDYSPTGTLTPFIGTNGQLFIRTEFTQPAVIDEPLIGKVSTKGGAFSFDFSVPTTLQTPLPDADQQIDNFALKFNKLTSKKKTGLVTLTSCPKSGKYVFKGDFQFKGGQTATASTEVKCKAAKK